MYAHFCLAFRFLDDRFHGRGDAGRREWPPSPLRAFQSLVAAAARPGRGALEGRTQAALKWLETQPAPRIISPAAVPASGYVLSVPNNAMDIVARAWCGGNYSNSGDASPATHRTLKPVRPTLLFDGPVIFVWPIPKLNTDEVTEYAQSLFTVARCVSALGWGIDMAIADGSMLSDEELERLPGERWLPGTGGAEHGLRVPICGTLEDVMRRHQDFLTRVTPEGFVPSPPLRVYRQIEYRRATNPQSRSIAAFSLLRQDGSGFRPFDTVRRGLTVAGMVRYATKLAAERSGGEWTQEKINSFILGHGGDCGDPKEEGKHVPVGPHRFAYLPLPSIQPRGGGARVIGDIRRVMLSCFAGGADQKIIWARRMLSGQDLVDARTNQAAAMLAVIPNSDNVVRCYTQPTAEWATVTPVVLPGYDDPNHYRRRMKAGTPADEQKRLLEHLDQRIEDLLRKAISQAGLPQVLADSAELDWRKSGFWPGNDLADCYGVPDHLKRFPRYHVKIRWRDGEGNPIKVPGPICIGGGRYYGVGLLAAFEEN